MRSVWDKGDRVEIAAGEHAGKLGTVTHVYSGGTVSVLLDGQHRSVLFGVQQLRRPSQLGFF
ncbi:KOW motif-containing protein [Geobacter sp.]|uniref:KOW motif-containing protein n=1 Tax=Geobacter sp. TaxID=46610 RepID=UPI0026159A23|nr:KOW motif-containing protein [Geobacter sp.]